MYYFKPLTSFQTGLKQRELMQHKENGDTFVNKQVQTLYICIQQT